MTHSPLTPNRGSQSAKGVLLSSVWNVITEPAIPACSFKILPKFPSIIGSAPKRICGRTPRCLSVSCDPDLVVNVRLFASMTSYFDG